MQKILTCTVISLITISGIISANDQKDDRNLEVKHMVKKTKCLSKNCIGASHRIFEYINDKVDPCEDFNEFACGGFNKNTIIPDDKSRWDVFSILTKGNLESFFFVRGIGMFGNYTQVPDRVS